MVSHFGLQTFSYEPASQLTACPLFSRGGIKGSIQVQPSPQIQYGRNTYANEPMAILQILRIMPPDWRIKQKRSQSVGSHRNIHGRSRMMGFLPRG